MRLAAGFQQAGGRPEGPGRGVGDLKSQGVADETRLEIGRHVWGQRYAGDRQDSPQHLGRGRGHGLNVVDGAVALIRVVMVDVDDGPVGEQR